MYYHFCTNGLLKNLLFVSDQDYIYAMNTIAFSKLKYPSVNILAFCIMNNHVHFIFDCEENEGRNFMIYYKRRIGMYLHDLYPNERNLIGADVACKKMSDPDYIVKAISAGIKLVRMNTGGVLHACTSVRVFLCNAVRIQLVIVS